jgi:catechol 2,3-dioxygenase-like lactoylglutathione lyase family enzyme
MKIKLTSVYVDDQEKALQFYTEFLGFVKKFDFPVGQFRWITVVSPEEPNGTELLLEPSDNPAAKTYQSALFEQGIAAASFVVDDIHQEHERLKELGVAFAMEPTPTGQTIIAVLDDTCGNFIQIYQV